MNTFEKLYEAREALDVLGVKRIMETWVDSAQVVRQAMDTAGAMLTDEQAATVPALYKEWETGVDYKADDRRTFNGVLYKCLQDHTSQDDWTPDVAVSMWAVVLIPDPEVIPEWVQPDSTNGYKTGDKVTHNGSTWESLVDNNIWEPGAVGTEGVWLKTE